MNETTRVRRIRHKALWITLFLQLSLMAGILYGAEIADLLVQLSHDILGGAEPELPRP